MLKIRSAVFVVGLLVLLTGTSHADTEVLGNFSVYNIYEYQSSGLVAGQLTPRCPCDNVSTVADCPSPYISLVDVGPICYDQVIGGSIEFTRGAAPIATPSFEVKGANASFPNPNTGIVLKSPSGTKCFLITVDENGVLQSTQTPCL